MSKVIKRYILLNSLIANDLEADVNSLLDKGWELYGYPFVSSCSLIDEDMSEEVYIQSMVKYDLEVSQKVNLLEKYDKLYKDNTDPNPKWVRKLIKSISEEF